MTRYYDPEIGRFVNADDVSYLDPETLNGCNLYAYCLNNPVMGYDPTGQGLLLIFSILAIGLVAGGVIGGLTGSNNGKEGWELVGDVAIGAAMGLAAAGIVIATGAVFAGASAALFSTPATVWGGVAIKQAFAIGALAYNAVAVIVAPLIGLSMELIDMGEKVDVP